ncbi:dephospho-CoA kinase [Pseudidiomarina sp. 1APR75-33.1]|uniref:dephospho-CoA kinase n=1 Tax=Pseudidiomarina terrestris TaxID=2820060 RepID=UPI0026549EBE|nr:dephospho-CoA kinase [Pseudidiomarina sp. 1APR75-33.1]MDN7126348.1 dephospho-CoA kinase [Pseudidiomarina sp. 1APR75-33.1]
MMWVLGLTGGIGSGKTTVSDLFSSHGITVVDADVIARHILDQGTPALAAVTERYGKQALTDDGSLNRGWLREKIFAEPEEKDWLNQLTHPLIRSQLLEELEAAASPYVILSAPLLVENNLTRFCDRVLVVDVSEETQRQRTLARDKVSSDQIEQILAAQASRNERLAAADDVINNEGALSELAPQVKALHQDYLGRAHLKRAREKALQTDQGQED